MSGWQYGLFLEEHEQIIPPSITVCSSISYKGVDTIYDKEKQIFNIWPNIYDIENQIFNNWPNNGTLVENAWKGK